MKRIFVMDGRSRAALSIIRSLGRKGYHVIVGESYPCASFYSKYVSKKLIYPDPRKQPELFEEFILNWAKNHANAFLIPVRDDCTEICGKIKDELEQFVTLLVPNREQFELARDKYKTIEIARQLNIPHPKTYLPKIDEDIDELKEKINLPFLIKPKVSSGSRGIVYIKNWNEFESHYKKITSHFGVPMLQEFIPQGGGFGVSLLLKNGEVYGKFTHKRIREYPISGGPSTLREGVAHPEMEEYAIRLMQHLKWDGVAMIEFRIDSRDGVPKLMEINPRFWGSLQTAVYSGVDFPHLLYLLGQGENCLKQLEYPLGRRVRWLLMGDILWFLSAPKTRSNIMDFLRFRSKNTSYEICKWDDLGPVYGTFLDAFNATFSRERRKHALDRGW
ncbi:ATP-grasp domain-containing protein [Marinifilum caeruleilacunae]|uniref:ATP-grasp domain-containing protein n=1 Tax=Marinifilum caeruleilacunae TaxID=2499076 RepID=A0ABX1WQP4_9BACT|nr:ATP-grasp domain-containing protein [Marinifilum caeruleilacunae]NOU58408.1 ATP-grasp domain-containing protein [Marinifilum caeruleilacunae]